MKIEIYREERGSRLADVSLVFEAGDGVLAGTKLSGFSIMRGKKDGELWVSRPSREYEKDGEKRRFVFLRPVQKDDNAGIEALQAAILEQYGA